jgi:hypothetical protein
MLFPYDKGKSRHQKRTPLTIQKTIFTIDDLLDVRVDAYLSRLNLALNNFPCQDLFAAV